ncbi:MAG: hypothetical protein IH624_03825, partial [Phycisphaerae bacterium]|nr:hypothetical protein [Phycisphaerae bacterium]
MATLAFAIDSRKLIAEAKQIETSLHRVGQGATSAFHTVRRAADIALGPLKLMTGVMASIKVATLAMGAASIKAAAQYEMFQQQLRTVIRTKQEADRAFRESMAFSVRTPFTPKEIIETRIALEAVGVKGGAAVEHVASAAAAMNRNILDVASSVKSMEAEPLRNLGIMMDEINAKVGAGWRRTTEGYRQAQQALLEIFESKFGGGLDRMSVTLQGLKSTLQGVTYDLRAAFGEGFIDQTKLIIHDLIQAGNALRDRAVDGGKALGAELTRARAGLLAAFDVGMQMADQLKLAFDAGQGGTALLAIFRAGAGLVGDGILAAFKASLSLWKVIGQVLGDAILEALYNSGIPGMEGIGRTKRTADISRTLGGLGDDQIRDMAGTYGIALQEQLYKKQPGQLTGTFETGDKAVDQLRNEIAGVMSHGSDSQIRSGLSSAGKLYGTDLELDKGYQITETLQNAGQTLTAELQALGDKASAAVQNVADEIGAAAGRPPVDVMQVYAEAYERHTTAGEKLLASWQGVLEAEKATADVIAEQSVMSAEAASRLTGMADGIGAAFGNAFERATLAGEGLRETLKGMLRDIAAVIMRT